MKRPAKTSTHSVRTTDDLWQAAKKRAVEEDRASLNYVLNEILEGYVRGLILLPEKQIIRRPVPVPVTQ